MKTVVLLAPTPPPYGGIAGWTERMMNASLKDGWQVRVVDEKVSGNRETFGDSSKRNIKNEIKRCFRIWGGLLSELRKKDTLVVHSCIPSFTLSMIREYVCGILTKIFGKKFIIHFRCTVPNTTKGKLGYFMLKRLCNISDEIMVLNKKSEECVKALSKTKAEVIPNFIAAEEISKSHKINEKVKTALYVGGVIEEKGAKIIVETAKKFPDITFRLVGKTDSEVLAFAEGTKNVEFLGAKPKTEIKKELMEADVFLFLSFYRGEGFSNALAEAMAAGLPTIVSDWAANKDMVEDRGGIVVSPNCAEEAIEALKKIQDPALRESQSKFNIEKTIDCYSDSVVLDMYVDSYNAIING